MRSLKEKLKLLKKSINAIFLIFKKPPIFKLHDIPSLVWHQIQLLYFLVF